MVMRSKVTEFKEIGESKSLMAYRYLGRTGMKVSVLAYGNWQTADSADKEEEVYQTQKACMKEMYQAGVNFFDTAEMYGQGVAESSMGRALKELGEELKFQRKDICVTTKIYWGPGFGTNDVGLSRKHVIEGMRASLKRMQMDYVDICFAHRPDYDTPLEETVKAFSWCIDNGLMHYWGTSEWPAQRIEDAIQIANRLGLHAPQAEQPQYNIMYRQRFEAEYKPIFDTHGYGTTIWSPLLMGILTGRYNDGDVPAGRVKGLLESPVGKMLIGKYFNEEGKPETKRLLTGLADMAKEQGVSQAQFALAWALSNPNVSTALLGFSRIEQCQENLKAIPMLQKWTQELEDKVEAHIKTTPDMPLNFRNWQPEKARVLEK